MEAGDVLDGRYRVEQALDQGGMGTIWTAIDLVTGQLTAVKVLRLDAYTQGRFTPAERARHRAELLKRFEREGAILEELKHPGIPRLLHRGYLGEEPYLVMEYVEGISLREFLDTRGPFPFDAAVAVAVQVAEALAHAHANGVVHRDLKPGNVVIACADGAVKLLDFGIAHLTDPDATRYTALGATPGSAGYMAPEQLRGQQDISALVASTRSAVCSSNSSPASDPSRTSRTGTRAPSTSRTCRRACGASTSACPRNWTIWSGTSSPRLRRIAPTPSTRCWASCATSCRSRATRPRIRN